MAPKDSGKANDQDQDWFAQSLARFRAGTVDTVPEFKEPRRGGVWGDDDDDDLSNLGEDQKSIWSTAASKSRAKKRPKSAGAHERERVAAPSCVPSIDVDQYDESTRASRTKTGQKHLREEPKQVVVDKPVKKLRFENTVNLSFNPTRFCSIILGRPVVVSFV